MATLCSVANGNFTSSSTWALVDATSYAAGENATLQLGTGFLNCAAFTPGAITIDGIGVKLNQRQGTTGTITVELQQGGSTVTGTTVTINCSDLPAAVPANDDGGWIFFKFGSSKTLSAATAYTVAAKTSSSTQVVLWRATATANDFARFLRTTTTQAPVAGDDFIVTGEHTGAGTGNNLTVTMDSTAATAYGSAPSAANSLLTSCSVNKRGTLAFGTSASTNYILQIANSLLIYLGGTLTIGTSGTPVPITSTATLQFNCGADGDYGLINRGGTLNAFGVPRTAGKNVVQCLLNSNAAANATSLGVDTDTGWLSGDVICVASTSRTAGESEKGTLNGNAGASSLTVNGFAGTAGGVLNAHSGTSPTQGEVILLTRNVVIRAVTSTIMSYVFSGPQAVTDIEWCELFYIGTNTAGKRGVEFTTVTGSMTMNYCSIHDTEDGALYSTGIGATNVSIQNVVLWNITTNAAIAAIIFASVNFGLTWTLAYITVIKSAATAFGGTPFSNTTINNLRVASATTGFNFGSNPANNGGFCDTLVAHSCSGAGFSFTGNIVSLWVTNIYSWRNGGSGFGFANTGHDFRLFGGLFFGNTTTNVNLSGADCQAWLKDLTIAGDSSFATTNGLALGVSTTDIIIDNCTFGVASGIYVAHTNDINVTATPGAWAQVVMRNCALASTVEVLQQAQLYLPELGYFMSSQKHDQTTGNHKTWMRYGTVATDTTIFNTASPSMRMTPNNASFKLPSAPLFRGIQIPVANGVAATISAYTRKSVVGDGAAYNGNQPRLMVRANPALGISADTLVATHSAAAGTWQQISGTSPTPTDDGVLEVFVDCDGTTGWVNVDDFAVS